MTAQPQPDPTTLPGRIESALAGRSIGRICRDSGITRSHLGRLRRGDFKFGPSLDLVERLAAALGVTPAWLGFGEVKGG